MQLQSCSSFHQSFKAKANPSAVDFMNESLLHKIVQVCAFLSRACPGTLLGLTGDDLGFSCAAKLNLKPPTNAGDLTGPFLAAQRPYLPTHAPKNPHTQVVPMLIELCAGRLDVDAVSAAGRSALHQAILNNNRSTRQHHWKFKSKRTLDD